MALPSSRVAARPFSPDNDDDGRAHKRLRTAQPQCLHQLSWPQQQQQQRSVGPSRRLQPVQELRDALDRLHAAEEMRTTALHAIQKVLPTVEGMVQQSTQVLAAHAEWCPSLAVAERSQAGRPCRAMAQSNRDNERICERAAGSLRLALQNQALSAAVSASASVAHSGNELCSTAGIVFHRRVQLESTLSAHSSAHNSRRSLCLRVLSIEYLRLNVLGNLSLCELWSLRRVCREFLWWSKLECAKLAAVPFCNQSAYGGISMVNPEHWAALKQDAAIACGIDGSIYRAGGFMREGMSTEVDPIATSTCDVWRPSNGRGGGSWHGLPNLKTARTHARACVVRLSGGGEALIVIGGRARRMSNDDFTTIEMLRLSPPAKPNGSSSTSAPGWTELPKHLPTRRRSFGVVACGPDRVAVVGGEARTSAMVVGGVVVDVVREALGTVEILDLTTGTWFRGPDMRRPRINPRVASAIDSLYVVGGSTVPGPSQLSGEHIAMCERLPTRSSWPDREALARDLHLVRSEDDEDDDDEDEDANEDGNQPNGTTDEVLEESGCVSSGATDVDWRWCDIGEIPRPEAYAAMKLQVQVVRRTLLCVQPAVASGSGHLGPRRDAAYVFDLDSRTWHCKMDVARVRN